MVFLKVIELQCVGKWSPKIQKCYGKPLLNYFVLWHSLLEFKGVVMQPSLFVRSYNYPSNCSWSQCWRILMIDRFPKLVDTLVD